MYTYWERGRFFKTLVVTFLNFMKHENLHLLKFL